MDHGVPMEKGEKVHSVKWDGCGWRRLVRSGMSLWERMEEKRDLLESLEQTVNAPTKRSVISRDLPRLSRRITVVVAPHRPRNLFDLRSSGSLSVPSEESESHEDSVGVGGGLRLSQVALEGAEEDEMLHPHLQIPLTSLSLLHSGEMDVAEIAASEVLATQSHTRAEEVGVGVEGEAESPLSLWDDIERVVMAVARQVEPDGTTATYPSSVVRAYVSGRCC